jgi:hypothetical protein
MHDTQDPRRAQIDRHTVAIQYAGAAVVIQHGEVAEAMNEGLFIGVAFRCFQAALSR